MTISKKQLTQSFQNGIEIGIERGKEQAKKEMLALRQGGIIELTKAAAELAQANAKLTYAMSQIANKLL